MNKERSLSQHIAWFLQEQTGSETVAQQGAAIQTAVEAGHTAVQQSEPIGDNAYIHCEQGWCGFIRHHTYERMIWRQFEAQSEYSMNAVVTTQHYQQAVDILGENEPVVEQWLAALSSVVNTRSLISGGPGTGKTTTIIKLLLLHLLQRPQLRIALCAPTGKAAHRMLQSMHENLRNIDHTIPQWMIDALPKESFTIHRLLKFNHIHNRFFYSQDKPLPYDVVIVDESSMLDVSLSYHLVTAVSPDSHLVMLGDAQQLPAVGAGFVFGDLCRKLKSNQSVELSSCLQEPEKTPIAVELTHSFRFARDSGIAAMASAIQLGQLPDFENYDDIQLQHPASRADQLQLLQEITKRHAQESLMMLTPRNQGSLGVAELNSLMQIVRYGEAAVNALKRVAENQPVIMTRNDYALNLFNGDMGIMQRREGQWWVEFEHVPAVPLKALRHWQCANALTIHRAQGSEYDAVIVALPDDQEHEMLSKELLYTAVTRAKKRLYIWSNQDVLNKAIKRSEQRQTFLQIF